MIVDTEFANTFIHSLPSKYHTRWDNHTPEEHEAALFEAEFDIKHTYRFKDHYRIWNNPTDILKQAICFQAIYILENLEDMAHDINLKNGIDSLSIQEFSANQGRTRVIYPKVQHLLNRYILRVGRFR